MCPGIGEEGGVVVAPFAAAAAAAAAQSDGAAAGRASERGTCSNRVLAPQAKLVTYARTIY